jgi:hypothetical protein
MLSPVSVEKLTGRATLQERERERERKAFPGGSSSSAVKGHVKFDRE